MYTRDVIHGKRINIKNTGVYEVELQKKIYDRLPSPYPSNCSDGDGIENFFTKRYSEEACQQSCQLRKIYPKCGAVFDRWAKICDSTNEKRKKNQLVYDPWGNSEVH